MINNVLQYLENSAQKYPDKVAFSGEDATLTFSLLENYAKSIGTCVSQFSSIRNPIAIIMEKSANTIAAFMGTLYAGCFFVPIDSKMPKDRAVKIIKNINSNVIICDEKNQEKARELSSSATILLFNDIIEQKINDEVLVNNKKQIIDTDLLYVFFTSGSTGEPKGVTISHRCMIDYTEFLHTYLGLCHTDVFGNQSPWHFDNSCFDIYSTLKNASTTYIVPQKCFMFPKLLINYLNDKKINTICWVPFALINIANSGILNKNIPKYLEKIHFGAEVMPTKQLNIIKQFLPNARYCNMYGPTETTIYSTYYILNREFKDDEVIPIGFACPNTRIIVLNDQNKEVTMNEIGELCILGSSLSFGYYNDEKKTNEVFVQNPLNTIYREIMYRTGDLVKYNELGELVYVSRKDFQIKHKGYRIELGEIEAEIMSIEEVLRTCCLYDSKKFKIVCFYVGDIDALQIKKSLSQKVSAYMVPEKYIKLDKIPQTPNGKIDRVKLKNDYM